MEQHRRNSPETIRKTALRAYCFADVWERKQPRDNSQNRPTGLLFCSLWGSRPIALQKQTFTSKLDQSVLCKSIRLCAVYKIITKILQKTFAYFLNMVYDS